MLHHAAVDTGAAVVLLGHTRDDQAETVLLNLLRGSATAGLAGMAHERDGIVRPLLGMRRSETRELCERLGLAVCYRDPGIGVGGFVSGVCFLLYFWSQHLNGTAGWLEVLLFIAGPGLSSV